MSIQEERQARSGARDSDSERAESPHTGAPGGLGGLALAKAYAHGDITPMQMAEHCLARAARSSCVFTRVTAQRALDEAERSTRRWRAGSPSSPLDGVPLSWKDLFDVQGTPTTAGSALLADAAPAPADAALVAHAAAAGMVCIGKTNLSEFAYSGLGLNPHFGTPVNPALGPRPRAPGGSSSGAALAVALDIAPIAIGTDTAGSVRIPAAFNGLVGYRASRQRYARAGVFPLAPSLDTVGPLARSVADCVAMDGILRGVPFGARRAASASLGAAALAANLERLRQHLAGQVFVVEPRVLDHEDVSAAVRSNLLERMRELRDAGVSVVSRTLPSLHATHALIDSHGWLGACEAFAMHQARLDAPEAARIDPRVRSRLEAARHTTAAHYLHLRWARQRLTAQFRSELGTATLVLPTTAQTAPLLGPLEDDPALFAKTNLSVLRLTMLGSFLDTPAVSLPSGLALPSPAQVNAGNGRDRLPTGMQLMRPQGDDQCLLETALSVEQAILSTTPRSE